MQPHSSPWRNRIAAGVLGTLVLVFFGVANFPYQYIERGGTWIGGRQFGDSDIQRSANRLPVMAGWPYRYSVQYENDASGDLRYWSSFALLSNVVVGLGAAALVFLFTMLRNRTVEAARDRPSVRLRFDISVAVLILLLPLSVYYQATRAKSRHWDVIRQSSRVGNFYVSAWLPESAAEHLPAGLVNALLRVRGARLVRPNDNVVSRIVQLDTLTSIEMVGGDFHAESLRQAPACIHLTSIRITSRDLDRELVASLAQLNWIVDLDLSNTNLDAEMLDQFAQWQLLEQASFRGTRIDLSQIGKPRWSSTIEQLALPRPTEQSVGVTLTVDGWPELRRLSVRRGSTKLNPSTLTLNLTHLPELEQLQLDRVQSHALICKDLPRLKIIEEDVMSLLFSMELSDSAPGLTWLTKLHLDGVASLRRVGCFARDLESLSIRNAPQLRVLELGSYLILGGGMARFQPVDGERCQQWINDLGNGNGPVTVDLTALPLDGIDLTPLVDNGRIRNLRMSDTGVTFEQVKGLNGMEQLERLDIGDCTLNEGDLAWLLRTLPKLRSMRVDVSEIEDIDLAGPSSLRNLQTTQFKNLRRLRIEDRPKLEFNLHLKCAPETIRISNAPALRGIIVEKPWPKGASVEGLRDLEWFSGGGPELGDSVVEALLDCKSADRIMLAHTAVSREKLSELGKLSRLSSLLLPGAPVDDGVTENWRNLELLQELNLDESSISERTLRWLADIPSLRRLSLNRVTLSDDAARPIADLAQLTDLKLADSQVPETSLIELLKQQSLERLDISGWPISKELADTLIYSTSLKSLCMKRCELDGGSLRKMMEANPSLQIDLGDAYQDYSNELIAELDTRRPRSSAADLVTGVNVIDAFDSTYEVVDPDENRDRESKQAAAPKRTDRMDLQTGFMGEADMELFRPAR